jgi:hypothetical protein
MKIQDRLEVDVGNAIINLRFTCINRYEHLLVGSYEKEETPYRHMSLTCRSCLMLRITFSRLLHLILPGDFWSSVVWHEPEPLPANFFHKSKEPFKNIMCYTEEHNEVHYKARHNEESFSVYETVMQRSKALSPTSIECILCRQYVLTIILMLTRFGFFDCKTHDIYFSMPYFSGKEIFTNTCLFTTLRLWNIQITSQFSQ